MCATPLQPDCSTGGGGRLPAASLSVEALTRAEIQVPAAVCESPDGYGLGISAAIFLVSNTFATQFTVNPIKILRYSTSLSQTRR